MLAQVYLNKLHLQCLDLYPIVAMGILGYGINPSPSAPQNASLLGSYLPCATSEPEFSCPHQQIERISRTQSVASSPIVWMMFQTVF
jgi:hypothetical protein